MVFEVTPPSGGVTVALACLTVFLALLTLVFGWFLWSASHATVAIGDHGVTLRVPLYGRTVPLSSLEPGQASVVDVDSSSSLRPTLRTNGIGLPGYGVGWFRLGNGQKALLALTRRKDVLYLPTTEGFVMLLSVRTPQRALERLRAVAQR